jgi:hypothetical protein
VGKGNNVSLLGKQFLKDYLSTLTEIAKGLNKDKRTI